MLEQNDSRSVSQTSDYRRTVFSTGTPSRQELKARLLPAGIRSVLDKYTDCHMKSPEPTFLDPQQMRKLFTIPNHPLWEASTRALWNSLLLSEDAVIRYSRYKELRIALDKCFDLEIKYENTLCAVWKEWTALSALDKSKAKLTSLVELSMSKGKISFKPFSQQMANAVSSKSSNPDFSIQLFLINSLFFNITAGQSILKSKLKSLEDVNHLPSSFFSELRSISENTQTEDWYEFNYLQFDHIKLIVTESLERVFPQDPRVNELWKDCDAPKQSEILLKCIVYNKSPKLQLKKDGSKKNTPVKLVDEKVKLPIFGKACQYNASYIKHQRPITTERSERLLPNTSDSNIKRGAYPKRNSSISSRAFKSKNVPKLELHTKIQPMIQSKLLLAQRNSRLGSRRGTK